jgi:hypothetical protein
MTEKQLLELGCERGRNGWWYDKSHNCCFNIRNLPEYLKFAQPMNHDPMTIATAFMRGDRIYLSGPISPNEHTPGIGDNLTVFDLACTIIMKHHGEYITVVNPACLSQGLDYDELMKRDYMLMIGCSHILMLPNWQYSKGACSELLVASQMGLKPRFLIGDMETVVKTLLDCVALKSTMLETLGEAVTVL